MTDRTPDDFSTRPSSFDDQPLDGGSEVLDFEIDGGAAAAPTWETESEAPSRLPLVLAAIGLLLLLAAAFWWFRLREAPQPPTLGSSPSMPLEAPDVADEDTGDAAASMRAFATDEETRDLAHGLGLNVFFDEKASACNG